jgi:hypothetical protein
MSLDYRKAWSPEEDAAIRALVAEFGLKKWSLVAQAMAERYRLTQRSGKQCRERWHNHLDASIDKAPWTQAEDDLIFELHREHGKSWSKIAERIPGRTDNSVKNRFYSTLRRNLRKYNKSRPHSQRLLGSVRTLLRNPDMPEILLQENAPARMKKNMDEGKSTQKIEEKEGIEEGKEEKVEVVVPVVCEKVETKKPGFERFYNHIEDAQLLVNLSQPELNYFYFYPQALASYKGDNKGMGCPIMPPGQLPMMMSNFYVKPQQEKK